MKAEIKKQNRREKYDRFLIISVFLCFLLFFASAAYCHKVYLHVWTERDTIYTESYSSGNKKVRNGLIKVFDNEGNELINGRTNEEGEFSFKIPKITDLRIVLESSMGDGTEYLFKKTEILSGEVTLTEGASHVRRGAEASPEEVAGQKQIRLELEAALDVRLKPVLKELARLQEDKGPGITEVIGGIGYILGIMGIVAYMRSKKK